MSIEQILAELRSPEPAARLRAIRRLRVIGGPQAVAAILGALDDPAVPVRSGEAVALRHMKALETIPTLAEHFRGDDSSHVRPMCVSSLATLAMYARSLGQDEMAQIAATLMVALAGPDWKMLLPAIAGLRSTGDPRAVPSLLRLLDHPRRNVRYGAARALLDLRVADRSLVTAQEKLAQEPEAEEHDLGVDEWNHDLEKQKRLALEMGDQEPQPHLKMRELAEQARQFLAQAGG
jgi:HEAT repeat protein